MNKILDDKIKANQAQYSSGREAPKMSTLSSKELNKFECLTGEDLGYKPRVAEQPKFEYSKFLIRDQKKKIRKKDF